MRRLDKKLFTQTILLVITLVSMTTTHSKDTDMDCPYKGKELSKEQLKQILDQHKSWWNDHFYNPYSLEAMKDRRRANLCKAHMRNTNLGKANLTWANLSGANLSNADLSEANLENANLERANLTSAKLNGTNLKAANLSNASLILADLSEANLANANLSKSNLSYAILYKTYLSSADLSATELVGTNFSGATLASADLRDARMVLTNLNKSYLESAYLDKAIFEPEAGTVPSSTSFINTSGLSHLRFEDTPHALIELRKAFRDGGFRQQEREITYAIKHSEIRKAWSEKRNYLENAFQYLFFELTTQWGMKPGRALLILLVLIFVFAPTYIIVLRIQGDDGIWQDWSDTRARKDLGTNVPVKLQVGLWKALWLGLYFSILSAFHIGWREINLGNWISRVQPREYTLRATGWVRTVSGIQSLISVYLVAICILTYFGRPFE